MACAVAQRGGIHSAAPGTCTPRDRSPGEGLYARDAGQHSPTRADPLPPGGFGREMVCGSGVQRPLVQSLCVSVPSGNRQGLRTKLRRASPAGYGRARKTKLWRDASDPRRRTSASPPGGGYEFRHGETESERKAGSNYDIQKERLGRIFDYAGCDRPAGRLRRGHGTGCAPLRSGGGAVRPNPERFQCSHGFHNHRGTYSDCCSGGPD